MVLLACKLREKAIVGGIVREADIEGNREVE
jgi:hypothetical protein